MSTTRDGRDRGTDPLEGVRLALSLLTVAPVRVGAWPPSRSATRTAMLLAPLVGAVLGLAAGGVAVGTRHAEPLLAGVLAVALLAVLTRGMHLDGLADTVDGLASYRPREEALAVMRRGDLGPLGAGALLLVLLAEVACVTALAGRHGTAAALGGVAVAAAAGRLTVTRACARGVPAARPEGLGAAVAGSVPPAGLAVCAAVTAGVAFLAVGWRGPAAVAAALLVCDRLLAHAVRRLGGVTGDALGASAEAGTAVALLLLALSY